MNSEAFVAAPEIIAGDHLIGSFIGQDDGPTIIAFGSLHGNEAAGRLALERVAKDLHAIETELRGRIYLLAGNTRALIEGVRFIDSDLNRHWTAANIIKNTNGAGEISEDKEQAELLRLLNDILTTAQDEVYALDLHSTSAEGAPFATVGDTLRNRAFAQKFPITILLGIEEQLEGTLLEYLNNLGTVTLGFEGGQHFADATVDTHEALVWAALFNAGVLDAADAGGVQRWNNLLKNATGHARLLEVRYRHAITEADNFRMDPGFNNFDPVRRGQMLASDSMGRVRAQESGIILMPLYQKLGEDGFFLGREVAPFWLWLSGVLRRLKVYNLMPLLPGVARSETDADTLVIDTRVARFFPLQIFHLLGYRRLRWSKNVLVVSRRRFDTAGPFSKR